ncbi:hypothetical protein MTO96_036047 [Rhipicephalus appendiculatus]
MILTTTRMNFSVVEFKDDKSIAVVPSSWIHGRKCYWPSGPGSKTSMVQKGVEPSLRWKAYTMVVKATFSETEFATAGTDQLQKKKVMSQEGQRSLTAEEALEVFFSLPDGSESDVSSDSGDEFVVPSTSALAPVDSSDGEENIEPPRKKKCRKACTRKKKPKKARSMPVENDTDQEEEDDDSHSAAWIAGQPSDIPVGIAEDPPDILGKTKCGLQRLRCVFALL